MQAARQAVRHPKRPFSTQNKIDIFTFYAIGLKICIIEDLFITQGKYHWFYFVKFVIFLAYE